MTKYPEIFAALAADFHEGEVKWRIAPGNQRIPYVSARTVMNRLDMVVGPENWWDAYREIGHTIVCALTIVPPGGNPITKEDAGGRAGMKDEADDLKSGYSDAFKRAAVKFGIGRLLYGDGTPEFGEPAQSSAPPPPRRESPPAQSSAPQASNVNNVSAQSSARAPAEDPIPGDPKTPLLPSTASKGQKLAAWADRQGHSARLFALAKSNYNCEVTHLNDDQADALYRLLKGAKLVEPKGRPAQGATNANGNPVSFGWPQDGKSLYAWAKNLQDHFKTAIIKSIDAAYGPGTVFDFPRSYKDWTPDQVEEAALYVAKMLRPFPGYDGQFDGRLPDLAALRLLVAEKVGALLEHQGHRDPSFDAINQVCSNHSATLTNCGGETIEHLETCDNASLLRGVLKSVEMDLAEIARVTA